MSDTAQHRPVVVGVDGSATSWPAVAWAAEEAATRRLPLRLVSAWESHYDLASLGLLPDAVRTHCQGILDAAREQVETAQPSVDVTEQSFLGPAARVLVESSQEADTVVVGSRNYRPLHSALIGGTSLDVVAHATCPVVVVRSTDGAAAAEGDDGRPHGHVVVGVDGSDASTEAVGYAFARAAQRDVPLTVLHAWQSDYVAGVISGLAAEETTAQLADEEMAVASESMAGWRDKFPDVQVSHRVVASNPIQALVDESKTASLLVVGSRGRGTITGALLGSIGHGVLHGSLCPVAVVKSGHGRR
ncbi:MAG: universal stress protein [Actinomycetota bacterium]|nr:universal stress protein [Actinomycetota bacterium]